MNEQRGEEDRGAQTVELEKQGVERKRKLGTNRRYRNRNFGKLFLSWVEERIKSKIASQGITGNSAGNASHFAAPLGVINMAISG
jgi:hypothetical protein